LSKKRCCQIDKGCKRVESRKTGKNLCKDCDYECVVVEEKLKKDEKEQERAKAIDKRRYCGLCGKLYVIHGRCCEEEE